MQSWRGPGYTKTQFCMCMTYIFEGTKCLLYSLFFLVCRSCAFRDVIGHSMSCDVSWLSTNPINPLSVGQFVNNHTRGSYVPQPPIYTVMHIMVMHSSTCLLACAYSVHVHIYDTCCRLRARSPSPGRHT